MASWVTHVLVAGALGSAQPSHVQTPRFWILSLLCSIVPDIDVLGYFWGIDYHHVFGHRGVMHSLCVAFGIGLVTVAWGFPHIPKGSRLWWRLVGYFFLVTASHGVLDAMTNGGLGVAFFAPFDDTRYFFPWRPLVVSPIGIEFFSLRGVHVLVSEMLFVWIPIVLMLRLIGFAQRKQIGSRRVEPWR